MSIDTASQSHWTLRDLCVCPLALSYKDEDAGPRAHLTCSRTTYDPPLASSKPSPRRKHHPIMTVERKFLTPGNSELLPPNSPIGHYFPIVLLGPETTCPSRQDQIAPTLMALGIKIVPYQQGQTMVLDAIIHHPSSSVSQSLETRNIQGSITRILR